MRWIMQVTEKFPKSERFRIAKQITDSIFFFQHVLIELVYCDEKDKLFITADIELTKLRIYCRLGHEMKLFSLNQYEYFAFHVSEIGRLLGGWKHSITG